MPLCPYLRTANVTRLISAIDTFVSLHRKCWYQCFAKDEISQFRPASSRPQLQQPQSQILNRTMTSLLKFAKWSCCADVYYASVAETWLTDCPRCYQRNPATALIPSSLEGRRLPGKHSALMRQDGWGIEWYNLWHQLRDATMWIAYTAIM